jgi:hypothetical protein
VGGAGGSSGPSPGLGGGVVELICNSISFTGEIDVSGGYGTSSGTTTIGASGGGGGGFVVMSTPTWVADTGEINIVGGPGGDCYNAAVVLSVPTGLSLTTTGSLALAHISTYAGGNPTVITVDNAGTGYNYTPNCAIVGTGGGVNTGSGATCTVTMAGVSPSMTVASISVTGGNAGYGSGTTYTTCGHGGYGGNGWAKKLTIN